MHDQMITNNAASDVGDLYIGAVKNHMKDVPELTMGEFACGATLCVGSIDSTGSDDTWIAWMKKFDDDPSAPTYVFMDTLVDHDGVSQHRIVFSTDPESNAITGTLQSN